MKNITLVLMVGLTFSNSAWSLALQEMYSLDANARTWYLGGIYDANVIDYRKNGERSDCIQQMGLVGFSQLMSNFVTALPQDPKSKERMLYDNMNVALIAALEIDKACNNNKKNGIS